MTLWKEIIAISLIASLLVVDLCFRNEEPLSVCWYAFLHSLLGVPGNHTGMVKKSRLNLDSYPQEPWHLTTPSAAAAAYNLKICLSSGDGVVDF